MSGSDGAWTRFNQGKPTGYDNSYGPSTLGPAGPKPTPEMEQRARLYVAGHATDATDCHRLLDMLGLLPEKTPESLDPVSHRG